MRPTEIPQSTFASRTGHDVPNNTQMYWDRCMPSKNIHCSCFTWVIRLRDILEERSKQTADISVPIHQPKCLNCGCKETFAVCACAGPRDRDSPRLHPSTGSRSHNWKERAAHQTAEPLRRGLYQGLYFIKSPAARLLLFPFLNQYVLRVCFWWMSDYQKLGKGT